MANGKTQQNHHHQKRKKLTYITIFSLAQQMIPTPSAIQNSMAKAIAAIRTVWVVSSPSNSGSFVQIPVKSWMKLIWKKLILNVCIQIMYTMVK